jgi:hypothetical protein
MKLLYRSIIIVVKKKSQENRQASAYWFKVDHYLSSEKLYFIILQKKVTVTLWASVTFFRVRISVHSLRTGGAQQQAPKRWFSYNS